MFEADTMTVTQFFLRWVHIISGITWIGLLYFLNLVNVPFQGVLEKELKPRVNPPLLGRALWWFRWSAMSTMLIGWILLLAKYGHGNLWLDGNGQISVRAAWILFGGILGTIMWFNVWFVIWPAQKQILTWVKEGQSPPEMAGLAKRALLFSRTNLYLSGPMLFGMIGPNSFSDSIGVSTVAVVTILSVAVIWGLVKLSPKVGTI